MPKGLEFDVGSTLGKLLIPLTSVPGNNYPTLRKFNWPSGTSVDTVERMYVTDGGWTIQVFTA